MPIFFILLLVSYLLGNIYIFVRVIQALGHLSFIIRGIFGTLYWICALLLFASFALRDVKQIPFTLGHIIFQIGSGWLAFTLYMVIFLACADLIKLFNNTFSYGLITALILTTGLLAYGYINYQHPDKQVINIPVNKSLVNKDKLKIIAISDLHLGLGTDEKRLKRNIDSINAENPDIILIAGDLIDSGVTPVISRKMDQELNRLNAPMGIYMVPGNHEYISGIKDCMDFINKTKIQLLKDSLVALPCGLQIIGRDDYSNINRLSTNDWAVLTDPSKPIIIIDHQPYNLSEVQRIGADLQVSGHTHNGQVIPLKFLTEYLFDISYGYEKRENTHFYVSSGLSLWGPPFRIGTNSEMVVFECYFAK
ncbi:MAG: metallophosphoesterase [Tannerella sp.]|jgi:predicted MPP superfamily phosphohydrolase|nr:metallophosphoesterase [Tannerella sp.]